MPNNLKLLTFFQNVSFRTQLLSFFLFIPFISILLIAISMHLLMKEYIINQNVKTLTAMVKQTAYNLDTKLKHYSEISLLPLLDRNFIRTLQNADPQDPMKTYQYIYNYFSSLLQSNSTSLANIIIYDRMNEIYKDGEVTLWLNDKFYRISDRLRLDTANMEWSGTWKDDRGQKVFSLFSRLHGTGTGPDGLIEVRIFETELYGLINEVLPFYQMYIISDGGFVMSSSDRTILGKHISELPAALHELTGITPVWSKLKPGGKEVYAVKETSRYGWSVITVVELNKLLDGFSLIDRYILLLASVAALLASLLTILFSNRFNYRMLLLNKKIQYIRRGEFDKEVAIAGMDEFGKLGLAVDSTRSELKYLIQEIKASGEQKRKAEMAALHAQINVHFIFNTLSSFRRLAMMKQTRELSRAIDVLASFFRISLSNKGDFITVEKEVEHLQAYAYLQALRYGDEIRIRLEVEPGAMQLLTVRLVLQPLVENSIFHGRKGNGIVLSILVRIQTAGNLLIFEVSDDGAGIPGERLAAVRTGIRTGKAKSDFGSGLGLHNVDNRIRLSRGEEFGLKIESEPSVETKVTVTQPCKPG